MIVIARLGGTFGIVNEKNILAGELNISEKQAKDFIRNGCDVYICDWGYITLDKGTMENIARGKSKLYTEESPEGHILKIKYVNDGVRVYNYIYIALSDYENKWKESYVTNQKCIADFLSTYGDYKDKQYNCDITC